MNRLRLLIVAVSCLMASVSHAADRTSPSRLRVYLGTYTGPQSRGIYHATFDLKTGRFDQPQLAAEIVNPSFVAIHPTQKYLYAVSEVSDFQGKKTGIVRGFAIDSATGALTALNQQSSEGTGPCHVVVDAAGKNALVANYGGGSVAVLPIDGNGQLEKATATIKHVGSSVNKQRQEAPHAHSINLDAANHFAFAADLGLDKILIYRFDSAQGTLTPNDPAAATVTPGSGPRHFAFHPSGKYAFVNNEMTSGITSFRYDAAKGSLSNLQTLSTLPADFEGENSTAETVVHPSGEFVYVSNRGHNSIAIFRVEESGGKLTPMGHASTTGKTPRNFNIDPTGRFLFAANQNSNDVVVFRIDSGTGQLAKTDSRIEVGSPVCVRFCVID